MRRREFTGLLAAIAVCPQRALGQAAKKRPVVAFLWFPPKGTPLIVRYLNQFFAGMRELGYVEGRDFEMVYRSADSHAERLPGLAAELVQLNPDVILGGATIQALAFKQATDKIPIIVSALADPELFGFAANDARPTGNVTGITPYIKGLPAKQLELAREVVPRATRIGLLDDVTDPKGHPQRREIEAQDGIGNQNHTRRGADVGRHKRGIRSFSASGVEVVVVEQTNMLILARSQIADIAAANATYSLRISRACRSGRPHQLRSQSGLVFSSHSLLCRQNIEGRQAI